LKNKVAIKSIGVKKMKYKEYKINEKLFGKEYLIYGWEETKEKIEIQVKSQKRREKCPECGESSSAYHATYVRRLQMVPINLKPTYAKIITYKYDCANDECAQKVFMEKLPFALPSQIRTTDLTQLILAVSIFMSNEGASKVLGLIGVKVSDDTIKRIYDRLKIEDEPDIESVGIDDVAIRKGHSYATAIYDLKSGEMVALLEGRDGEGLREWLKNHRKISLVTRDRASAYLPAGRQARRRLTIYYQTVYKWQTASIYSRT
jgi:transposase